MAQTNCSDMSPKLQTYKKHFRHEILSQTLKQRKMFIFGLSDTRIRASLVTAVLLLQFVTNHTCCLQHTHNQRNCCSDTDNSPKKFPDGKCVGVRKEKLICALLDECNCIKYPVGLYCLIHTKLRLIRLLRKQELKPLFPLHGQHTGIRILSLTICGRKDIQSR